MKGSRVVNKVSMQNCMEIIEISRVIDAKTKQK